MVALAPALGAIGKGKSLFSRGTGVLLPQQEPHPMGSTRDTDSALPVLPLSSQKPQCPKMDPAGDERAGRTVRSIGQNLLRWGEV